MIARTHNPALWDGDEPIVDALARHGLRDVFQLAVEGGEREMAIGFLREVGATRSDAVEIVEILWPSENKKPR
jgi:hypothetical protein